MFFKKYLPLEFGKTFGVLDGDYKGHTLIFVKRVGEIYAFCDFFDGKLDERWIPKKDFEFAERNGIIELADPQPTKEEKNEIKKITKVKFRQTGKL
jgi:hypothetical protein